VTNRQIKIGVIAALTVVCIAMPSARGAQSPPASPQVPHPMIQLDQVVWRGEPGALQTAIAEGNPQAAGPFTMLLKLPDGVWIPPHFHNVDKRLIVIKGELLMGHGDAIDASSTAALRAGGVAVMPANTHHYEGGKGETIVVLIANGPFTTSRVSVRR
jgi:quercetin dioxygenase-like cupin family protein